MSDYLLEDKIKTLKDELAKCREQRSFLLNFIGALGSKARADKIHWLFHEVQYAEDEITHWDED